MIVYAYRCAQCDGEAFYLRRVPSAGEKLESGDVVLGDGSTPEDGEHVPCAECGQDPARFTGLQVSRLIGPMEL